MKFGLAHKIVAYLFAGLGLAALMLGGTFGPIELGLAFAAFVATWFVESPLVDRPGYTRFWNVAAVVLLVVQAALVLGGEAFLTAGIQYAAFLQLSRLAHRKSSADYQQIVILGFLHLIAGTVLSSGLDYGVIFFGFVVVMPWMLALTHLRKELETQFGVDTPALRAQLRGRDLTTPAFFGGTTLLAVPLFVLTAAMFFAFPRVGFGLLSNLGSRVQSVAGFGDDVELGGFGTIRDDPTVVARIKPHRNLDPPQPSIGIRLRGTSFDRYREGRWARTQIAAEPVRRMQDEYILHRPTKPGDAHYEIILDPMEESVVFIPEGTVSLQIPPVVRSGRNRPRKIVAAPGLDVRYRERFDAPLTYRAFVGPDARSFEEAVPARVLRNYLEVPDGYEQISDLARSAVGDAERPIDKAQRLEAFLRSDGGYRYSLQQPDTRDQEPLHVFLFLAKSGHCEYFSTAMALMARTLGIPARNVTGFLGADYNPYGNYYAVRNGNAHSWVELLIDGKWVTFDPTPASRQVVVVPSGMRVKLRQMMDALRVRWAEYVVEFDIRDQARAFRGFLGWYRSLRGNDSKGLGDFGVKPKGVDGVEVPLRPDWRWFVAIMGAFGVGVLWLRWSRRRRREHRAHRELDPDKDRAVRLYLALENNLRRTGRARPPDVTPAEHADQLGRAGFVAADEVHEITVAYLATRFGEIPMPHGEYQRLKQMNRSIRNKVDAPPTA